MNFVPEAALTARKLLSQSQMPLPVTVLVVEDDRGVRDFMAAWLDAEGYQVRTARNGHEALIALNDEIPCIMVVDLKMPGMGGAELRRRTQRIPAMAAVPFVIVSAEADAEQIGRDLDVAAVVPKPFDAIRLSEVVAAHCHRP
jgi:DNA-binding response OmpR family regulator